MSAGRVACIVFPYAVSVGALISLIFVGIGSTNSKSSTENNLYFLRADLSNFTIPGSSAENDALSALSQLTGHDLNGVSSENTSSVLSLLNDADGAASEHHIYEFYDIGLWGYCGGNKSSKGDYQVTYCSKPKAEFAFDPITVWGLNSTDKDSPLNDLFPKNVKDDINTYKSVSKWMFIAYMVAFVATVLELAFGIIAIYSRIGSLITSLISGVAFFFTAAASATATAIFAVVEGEFNSNLKKYGIHATMGGRIYAATWFATVFALAATLFWLFSSCCCAARSPYHGNHRRNRVMAEKAPYTYERVSSPYSSSPFVGGHGPAPPPGQFLPQEGVPMQSYRQDAYEPFRHV